MLKWLTLYLWMVATTLCVVAQEMPAPGPRIPENEIAALRAELTESRAAKASSVDRRRACKNVAREGTALVEAHPTAPNRYDVLGIVLQSQKWLLDLENTERNRQALFATCTQLAQAPDEYSELRLEADTLLSERDLAAKEATLAERAQALKNLIARYRDTPAEAKSLMMASLIAPQLEARELELDILEAMDDRFSGDTDMIAFRRNNLGLASLAVKCMGKYTRADGAELFLPADRIGHHCIMVFWSQDKPGSEDYLKQVEEERRRFADLFDIYSFNLDELPDAGEGTLRKLGLDWTAIRLPGGRKHQSYCAYATRDPVGIVINAYGYTILTPMAGNRDSAVGVRGLPSDAFKISDERVSHDRYLAQLQSLFIGDFLVTDPVHPFDPAWPPELKWVSMNAGPEGGTKRIRTPESVPGEVLSAIQACFIVPPFRYRLTRKEALAHYRKAEELCDDALKRYPNATDLWIVRNRRIIALLGRWNLVCDPTCLERAVQEAKTSLARPLPPGAEVVPRFCLAKEALRQEVPEAASVLPAFIEATGGAKAPASTLAAASILALDANARELHEQYRNKLLGAPGDGNPLLWPIASFLRDRYHRLYLLKPNSTRRDQKVSTRSYIVNHDLLPTTDRMPGIELKALDGSTLSLPREANSKLTLLLFVEPPVDPNADFPVVLDRQGKPTHDDHIRHVMKDALGLAEAHVNKEVDVIAAFLCDDAKRVDALMKKNGWTCQAAMVPGGLKNPMVLRLGILSADRVPNVFLLRRDGTIAWWTSGLEYKDEFGYPFALLLGMKVHIEACEVENGYRALAKGDFQNAARIFAGPFLPAEPDRYGWRAPRLHGSALAHMGLNTWDAAITDIDAAIDAHKLQHYHYKGRGPKRVEDWREGLADIEIKASCEVFSELWMMKAIALEQLGRKEEGIELQKRTGDPAKPDSPTPYGVFHDKLKQLRLAQPWGRGPGR